MALAFPQSIIQVGMPQGRKMMAQMQELWQNFLAAMHPRVQIELTPSISFCNRDESMSLYLQAKVNAGEHLGVLFIGITFSIGGGPLHAGMDQEKVLEYAFNFTSTEFMPIPFSPNPVHVARTILCSKANGTARDTPQDEDRKFHIALREMISDLQFLGTL